MIAATALTRSEATRWLASRKTGEAQAALLALADSQAAQEAEREAVREVRAGGVGGAS